MPALDSWRRTTAALLATLALLEICWELWLAPLRPGGSWLALKALPLVALWPGVARSKTRALQWALLLLPWYFAEGVVRAFSESGSRLKRRDRGSAFARHDRLRPRLRAVGQTEP